MKSAFLALVAMAIGATAFASTRPLIVTSQDRSLLTIDDCEHFYARTLTSLPAEAQSTEERGVALEGVDTVHIRATEGGGVSVRGWDRPVARLTVCKYAMALTEVEARKTLGDVFVSSHNGDIAATGPQANEGRAWWVHMILRVPRSASIDVASLSGGIAIRNMNGRISARATNGGIFIARCSGESRLWTENGGISLEKIGGRLDATSRNGSINLRLQDDEAPTIEARTDGASEILCRARACQSALTSRAGDTRVLRIGAGAASIHLSAASASILIQQLR